ncbi:MAG: DNA-directed RNA polymerase subunit alpha C-terminal domain-containing protein [Chloroflexota bacterium]
MVQPAERLYLEPVPETLPERQRDRWRHRFPWSKTAVGASPYDDSLVVTNGTSLTWMLWHRFHALGSIPPDGQRAYRLVKSGLLVAQVYPPPTGAVYILLELAADMSKVEIVDISGNEGLYTLQTRQAVDLPPDTPETASESSVSSQAIKKLKFSWKLENALKLQGLTTVDQLAALDLNDVANLKGLAPKQRKELLRRLIDLHML